MTLAIYRSVQVEAENAHQAKRHFSVSGVLSELDLSLPQAIMTGRRASRRNVFIVIVIICRQTTMKNCMLIFRNITCV